MSDVTDTTHIADYQTKLATVFRDIVSRRYGEVDDIVENQNDFGVVQTINDLATSMNATDIDYEDGLFEVCFADEETAIEFSDQADDLEEVEEVEVVQFENGSICVFVSLFASDTVAFDYDDEEDDQIDEVKRLVKVNAQGKRRIKMKCRPGFKWNGKTCIKISGQELATKRIAKRKAIITKRSQGSALKVRVLRKTRKARRFRKAMGLR